MVSRWMYEQWRTSILGNGNGTRSGVVAMSRVKFADSAPTQETVSQPPPQPPHLISHAVPTTLQPRQRRRHRGGRRNTLTLLEAKPSETNAVAVSSRSWSVSPIVDNPPPLMAVVFPGWLWRNENGEACELEVVAREMGEADVADS